MKFLITRTSDGIFSNKQPCENAIKDFEFNGQLVWSIELNEKEILDFCLKNSPVIITDYGVGISNKHVVVLEIYDDYRE